MISDKLLFKDSEINIEYNFKNGIQVLERDGFRIQQEIPHDYSKNAN